MSVTTLCLALCLPTASDRGKAHAGDNDVVISRLSNVIDGQMIAGVDGQSFRSLASELGVVLAPRLLSPSDTLGFAGFQFAADFAFTTISNDKAFWRARESSDGMENHGGSTMPTIGVFVRKGLWLPLPSFEVGAGIVHLLDSSMIAAQGYAKLAVHEGYRDLPIPSLAVRGAVSRMMGTAQLDLTIASVDVSISKAFAFSGSIDIEPYGGWNALFIIPRGEVIDPTPDIPDDPQLDFVFRDQDDITRNRFFVGAKVQYYVFAVLIEADLILSGKSKDDREGQDQAGTQQTYTLGLGVDF